jgi:hypothetical protein
MTRPTDSFWRRPWAGGCTQTDVSKLTDPRGWPCSLHLSLRASGNSREHSRNVWKCDRKALWQGVVERLPRGDYLSLFKHTHTHTAAWTGQVLGHARAHRGWKMTCKCILDQVTSCRLIPLGKQHFTSSPLLPACIPNGTLFPLCCITFQRLVEVVHYMGNRVPFGRSIIFIWGEKSCLFWIEWFMSK